MRGPGAGYRRGARQTRRVVVPPPEDDPRMITLSKEDGPADLDGVTHLSIG
ncbi:stress protein, partial [[Kitasatospora] papulosa]